MRDHFEDRLNQARNSDPSSGHQHVDQHDVGWVVIQRTHRLAPLRAMMVR
jgi:hypothetical protein